MTEFWQKPNFSKCGDTYWSWHGWQSSILLPLGRRILEKETAPYSTKCEDVPSAQKLSFNQLVRMMRSMWFTILRSMAKRNFCRKIKCRVCKNLAYFQYKKLVWCKYFNFLLHVSSCQFRCLGTGKRFEVPIGMESKLILEVCLGEIKSIRSAIISHNFFFQPPPPPTPPQTPWLKLIGDFFHNISWP